MGRFSAAKMIGAIDAKFQRYYNELINLLDLGYVVEKTINGKRIKISIDPTNVVAVTVDGVKVFGISSTGRIFAEALSNQETMSTYAEIGSIPGGGFGFSLWGDDVNFIRIAKTIDGGFAVIDANDLQRFAFTLTGNMYIKDDNGVQRFAINSDGTFYVYDNSGVARLYITPDGSTYFYDESGEARFYSLSDGSFHVRNSGSTKSVVNITATVSELRTPTATDNRIGVDETGPYYVKAGVKTYF